MITDVLRNMFFIVIGLWNFVPVLCHCQGKGIGQCLVYISDFLNTVDCFTMCRESLKNKAMAEPIQANMHGAKTNHE